ncbi:hypothetical protein A0J61_11598, partial [Choanephora cucurbitarum]
MNQRNEAKRSLRDSCSRIEDLVLEVRREIREVNQKIENLTSTVNRCAGVLEGFGTGQSLTEHRLRQRSQHQVQEATGALLILRPSGPTPNNNKKSIFFITMMIFALERLEIDWSRTSYTKTPIEVRNSACSSLRSLDENRNIPTSRCHNFWLEDAVLVYLYHNKARPIRPKCLESAAAAAAATTTTTTTIAFAVPATNTITTIDVFVVATTSIVSIDVFTVIATNTLTKKK